MAIIHGVVLQESTSWVLNDICFTYRFSSILWGSFKYSTFGNSLYLYNFKAIKILDHESIKSNYRNLQYSISYDWYR